MLREVLKIAAVFAVTCLALMAGIAGTALLYR